MKARKGTNNDLSKMLQDLMSSYHQMILIADQINNIAQQTNLLSLNSSIEAARVGEQGRGFAVIAKEIQSMSQQSQKANVSSRTYIEEMKRRIDDVAGVRTADIAFDLIDKIDRNLFERNCDVQAWATFEAIIEFLLNPTESCRQQVTGLLREICRIYEVYYDLILADVNGVVVSNARKDGVAGTNVKNAEWYNGVMQSGSNTVTDMYLSKDYGYTVAYSAPVKDRHGKIIGVLTSRFNWEFIYDIIDKAKISPTGQIYVLNSEGLVIASKNRSEIFKKSFKESDIFRALSSGEYYGYILEEDGKGNLEAIAGYARTRGYNAYSGKNWSVIVEETF